MKLCVRGKRDRLKHTQPIANHRTCNPLFPFQEQAEFIRKNPQMDLTPEMWLAKLLLGAIE